MALLAGGKLRFHKMIVACAHMAAHAGVLHHIIVSARLAFNTLATGTEQDIALNTQMRVKARVGGSELGGIGLVNEIRHVAASLMAVGTQVARTTVEGQSADDLRYRLSRLKSPVLTRVRSVDLVAGAAVLMGGVGIALFDLGKVLAGGDHGAERGTGVTTCTGIAGAFFDEGYARTMQ
jgi:hypothetical protein